MKKLISLLFIGVSAFAQIANVANTTASSVRSTINGNFTWLEAEKLTYLGAYSAGTTYAKSAVVSSSGVWYVSLQGSNTGNTPASSGTYWVAIPGSGSGGSSALVRDYPAAACQSAAASLALSAASATQPVPDCAIGTNGVIYGVAKFANSGTFAVQGHLGLPASLTSAAVDITWRTSIANTGLSAKWSLQTACLADNESDDPTFNAAQTVTTAAKSAANRHIVSTISTVTLTGCAATERLHWILYRDPTGDTLGATAELISVKWTVQ